MKKALILLSLLLCGTVVLTSCNNSSNQSATDNESTTSIESNIVLDSTEESFATTGKVSEEITEQTTELEFSSETNGSGDTTDEQTGTTEYLTNHYTQEEIEAMKNPNFSRPFSSYTDDDDKYSDDEMKSIISRIPYDKYEVYPHLNNVPLTATLYKGNEVISLDIKDPRLIQIINFYNNSIYNTQYAYTQGLLNISEIEKALNQDFRLVITFDVTNSSTEIVYDTNIQAYDTMVIYNKEFVLIAHNLPGYEGAEEEYPFKSVGHSPLFYSYRWLDLFGF